MGKKPTTIMIRRATNNILRFLHIKRRLFMPPDSEQSPAAICYAITVCNEHAELERLLTLLAEHKRPTDSIVVQADADNVTDEVKQVVEQHKRHIARYETWALNHDFARAKNNLGRLTHCRYIFQLDADEMPSTDLIRLLPCILAANPDIELFKLPRTNLFVDEGGTLDPQRVSWPDYQGRIYLNTPQIRWTRPIHERISGHRSYVYLPATDKYALIHIKNRKADYDKWQRFRQQQ